MNKIILVVLMAVMIASPCFAQEVEPEGIFSIEGTKWQALPIGLQMFPLPWIWVTDNLEFGFYRGEIFTGQHDSAMYYSFYIDMLACSIFKGVYRLPLAGGDIWYYGIVQPIGIGMVAVSETCYYCPIPAILIRVGILIKTEDDWAPPVLISISPNRGEQGTKLTDVTIMSAYTNFESGVDDIIFVPDLESIDISNIRTISNTEIKFDLNIQSDAEIEVVQFLVEIV
jgi:hypothetical protein